MQRDQGSSFTLCSFRVWKNTAEPFKQRKDYQTNIIGGSTSLLIRVISITSCYLKDSNIFENFLKTLWWHFGVSFINFADQMRLLLRFPTPPPPNQSLEVGQFRTSFHWRSGGGRGDNVSLGIERFCKK